MTDHLRITEVGPRDGLQNETGRIPTGDKIRLVELLCLTGVAEIEVSSFVSPKWIPQLGDANEVFTAAERFKPRGMTFSALVPNARGLEAALAVNEAAAMRVIDKISVFTAASETFSQRNTNASIAETLARFEPVIAGARQAGLQTRGYVSCAIACPIEGPIAPDAVATVARKLRELGIEEIDVADTIGVATPLETVRMLEAVAAAVPPAALTLHLHDTFGRAVACAVAAWGFGIRSFDAAVGGLGGCPYASTPERRAPGNVDTQTLLTALRAAGGTDEIADAPLAAAATFAREIVAKARSSTR